MPTVIVNGREIEIEANERLNCIQAAQRADVEIPRYCWHPELSVVASCRMCLVEVGERKPDGSIVMGPKLVPGCQTPVKPETVIVSNSAAVIAAQKATLEYLLLNHPLDCPVCDQAGECYLQDYSYKFGRGYSRLQEPKVLRPDKDDIGDQITLFTDRCVMCTRCVRFTREISGTGELQVIDRGSHSEIDIFPGEPCNNKLAGNVVDLCPVGALCSKDFLYEQRVWWLESAASVCPDCSTGCSIRIDQNKDVVYRLKPRQNPLAQGDFMCDEGRFGYKYINRADRLTQPLMRFEGEQQAAGWETVFSGVRAAIEGAITSKPHAVAAVLSPWMTVEEAYLLASHLKSLSKEIRLYLGPVRIAGEDDRYPKDVHGNAVEPTRFTIRAEKCPNRTGVEAIIRHYQGSILSMDDFWKAVAAGQIDAAYLVGGDPHEPWISEEQGQTLETLKLTIVQDLLPSAASRRAHYVLPGGSFAERDGTFVNHAGLAQLIKRAMHSPEEARPDNRILWELAGRRGLFNSARLRTEIAETIPALQALGHKLGEFGVMLETPGKDARAAATVNAAASE
ncbi:MAG: molybdopterin-dependent oxidoreductase [Planctomycetaceae bacterium]